MASAISSNLYHHRRLSRIVFDDGLAPFAEPEYRSRRWFGHLWREWTIESARPIASTTKLSDTDFEPFREPIERFEEAFKREPQRIALREIRHTFVLP